MHHSSFMQRAQAIYKHCATKRRRSACDLVYALRARSRRVTLHAMCALNCRERKITRAPRSECLKPVAESARLRAFCMMRRELALDDARYTSTHEGKPWICLGFVQYFVQQSSSERCAEQAHERGAERID